MKKPITYVETLNPAGKIELWEDNGGGLTMVVPDAEWAWSDLEQDAFPFAQEALGYLSDAFDLLNHRQDTPGQMYDEHRARVRRWEPEGAYTLVAATDDGVEIQVLPSQHCGTSAAIALAHNRDEGEGHYPTSWDGNNHMSVAVQR